MFRLNDELNEEGELEQENLFLKDKIIQKGGHIEKLADIEPEIENQFLKNVLAFEEAEEKRVFEILGINPNDFPPVNRLTQEELQSKFELLIEIMAEHNFIYELTEDLPISIAYRYLTEEFLHEFESVLPDGWMCHVNGCGGDCPSCFQADYCQIKDDIWSREELEAERLRRQEEDKESEV